jgi:hypothetical protein
MEKARNVSGAPDRVPQRRDCIYVTNNKNMSNGGCFRVAGGGRPDPRGFLDVRRRADLRRTERRKDSLRPGAPDSPAPGHSRTAGVGVTRVRLARCEPGRAYARRADQWLVLTPAHLELSRPQHYLGMEWMTRSASCDHPSSLGDAGGFAAVCTMPLCKPRSA